MIRNFIIALLFVITACSSGSKEQMFFEYIKSYNKTIKIINKQNEVIFKEFNNGMNDFFSGTPLKISPWYKKAMSIKQKADHIIQKIDSLENTLGKNLTERILSDSPRIDKIGNRMKVGLKKSDIIHLKSEFLIFQKLLIATMGKDTFIFKPVANSITEHLYSVTWNYIPCLSGQKSTVLEILAVLSKLKMNIKLAESDVLGYLFSQIDVNSFRFYKTEAIVESNALIIPQGRIYSANIFIGVTDSTVNPEIFVEGEELEIRSGIGIYIEKVSSKDKFIRRKGYFLLTNPATGLPVKTNFQLEYEVVK